MGGARIMSIPKPLLQSAPLPLEALASPGGKHGAPARHPFSYEQRKSLKCILPPRVRQSAAERPRTGRGVGGWVTRGAGGGTGGGGWDGRQ